jgi:hypothetical protein
MSRVYILGAGCSYHEQHGYPLAKQFVAELNSYIGKIEGIVECQRIKKAVEDTVKLFTQGQSGSNHASTIDQLINLILNKRCDDQLKFLNEGSSVHIAGLRQEAVRKAKIATAACFFEKEKVARQHQIDKYKEFIQRKVLNETGVSTSCHARLQKSSARVLSFNYDRLFELAFFASFADVSINQFYAYSDGILNSGLTVFGNGMEIQKDKFCFLKLHGTIGMQCTEDAFGQEILQIGNVIDWKEEKITDELFFPATQKPHFSKAPLIVFPYEKDFIVSGKQNALPFRDYINAVWSHATYVLQEASEIWVIGYSFDPTDCNYLVERIQQAKKCERIVIQNLPAECERIESLLKIDYRIQIPIEKYQTPF